jgi:cholesterol transport system auxiliary component
MTGTSPGPLWRAIVVAFGAAVLSGCALLTPAKTETAKLLLSPPALDLPQRRGCAATLLVFAPQAEPLYDTTQMAYSTQTGQVAYFGRHEWGETPSQMLLPLLVNALRGTRCFDAVVTPPYPYAETYGLRTDIKELLQDYGAQPATLRLSLRVQLSDASANRVIASRDVTLGEPIRGLGPEAGVTAANAALAAALGEVVRFVLAATSSSRSRP